MSANFNNFRIYIQICKYYIYCKKINIISTSAINIINDLINRTMQIREIAEIAIIIINYDNYNRDNRENHNREKENFEFKFIKKKN